MFMRITWGQLQPGLWDDFVKRYEEDAADPSTAGLKARWLVRDSHNIDNMFAVTLWEDKESIERWERSSAYKEFLEVVEPFMMGSYSVSVCEVMYANPAKP